MTFVGATTLWKKRAEKFHGVEKVALGGDYEKMGA
jgi:hypothetical protein